MLNTCNFDFKKFGRDSRPRGGSCPGCGCYITTFRQRFSVYDVSRRVTVLVCARSAACVGRLFFGVLQEKWGKYKKGAGRWMGSV